MRKVWSKVFSDIEDQPSKQIRRLKEILAELGMSEGRMSLEKARAIKEKRELAKELGGVLLLGNSFTTHELTPITFI